MVGSKRFWATAAAGSATAHSPLANASVKPVPAAPMMKPRRESAGAGPSPSIARRGLSTRVPLQFLCGQLDRGADAHVGHAPTQVPSHHRIDVLVGRVGEIAQQRGSLHDLPGLAVATLGCLCLDPCLLQWVMSLGVK